MNCKFLSAFLGIFQLIGVMFAPLFGIAPQDYIRMGLENHGVGVNFLGSEKGGTSKEPCLQGKEGVLLP